MGVPLAGHGIEGAFRALRQRVTEPDHRVLQVLRQCIPRQVRPFPVTPPMWGCRAAATATVRGGGRVEPEVLCAGNRLHKAMAAAHRSRVPQWAEIAQQSGFYDQPHMLAEFRRAVGSSCVRFFQANAPWRGRLRCMSTVDEIFRHQEQSSVSQPVRFTEAARRWIVSQPR